MSTPSERITFEDQSFYVHTIDDLLRSVVQQTQPVAFSEVVGGLRACLAIKPHTTLDHLNDLVQQGFLTVDETGRFSCRG